MPIDSTTVGGLERTTVVLGDPLTAGNKQAVIPATGDGKSIAGISAALMASLAILQNSAGTYDLQRGAVGAPGVAAVNSEGSKASFSCGITDYTPYATPTDFWTLVGSGTTVIRVQRICISGVATVAIASNIQLYKRTAANTGGTTAQPSIGQHDSNDPAPTAVVNTYSVIPGALGAGKLIRSDKLNQGVPAGGAGRLVWEFGTRNAKGLVLRGVAQCLALNFGGAVVPAGTLLNIDVEFTEE